MIVIEVKYELGHAYKERWEESEILCPFCSAREVWRQLDASNEHGQPHICSRCWTSFEIGDIAAPGHNMQFLCRMEAIKTANSQRAEPQAQGQQGTDRLLNDEELIAAATRILND